MAYNEKSKAATYAYREKSYARVNLDMKKEEKERWKAAADAANLALNAYIKQAVSERIERDQSQRQKTE